MLKLFCLLFALLFMPSIFANQAMLATSVYYLSSPGSGPTTINALLNQTDDTGKLQVRWADYAGEGAVYKLEISLAGSSSWQTIYQGENLYARQEQVLPSNSYNLRLSCSGSALCLPDDYIALTIGVVSYEAPALAISESADSLYWSVPAEAEHFELEVLTCESACSIDELSPWQSLENAVSSSVNTYPLNTLSTQHYAFRVKACSQLNQCGAWSNAVAYDNTKPRLITYEWRPSVIVQGQEAALYFNVKNAEYCNIWLIEPIDENLEVTGLGSNAHSSIRSDYLPGKYTANGYCSDSNFNKVPDFEGLPETYGNYLRSSLTVLSEPDGIHIPNIMLNNNGTEVHWDNSKIQNTQIYYIQYGTCENECSDSTSVSWNPATSAHMAAHPSSLLLDWYKFNKGYHYAFKIKGCPETGSQDNCYGWSNKVYFTIPNPIEIYLDISESKQVLRWEKTSAEHHYELELASCQQDCSQEKNLNWQSLNNQLDYNRTSYELPDLAEAYYAFRVRACNSVSECDTWSALVHWNKSDQEPTPETNSIKTELLGAPISRS
ncbi:hypothetical protein SG34_006365 [Thalassomonas viridans]|uniref:Fibronectin type-III domain-containing protein n=1 Tax=Thalassomonas viridans TaxID=137584 RepID=A0AAF0CA65_9GAMM|nr:hypothetical protein [Thalassomonas viridans]WDE06538.1 hypothetical protein SG34_006365 [Thalassomonas viridans]